MSIARKHSPQTQCNSRMSALYNEPPDGGWVYTQLKPHHP